MITILWFVIIALILWLVFWLINTYVLVMLPEPAQKIIRAILVILFCIWLLSAVLGYGPGLHSFPWK
jgi:hypothetical protein